MDKLWISILIVCITAFVITTAILIYLGVTNSKNRKSKNEQSATTGICMWLLYSTIFSKQPLQVEVNVIEQEKTAKQQSTATETDNSSIKPEPSSGENSKVAED